MSIQQRGSSWQVYVKHNGQRVRETVATQEEAITREAEIRVALLKGTYGPQKPQPVRETGLTISALRDRVYTLVWSRQKAARESASVARQVVAYFGDDRSVSTIDRKAVGDFRITLLAAGNSPATVNRKLASLSKMLSVACEEGWIPNRPKITRERESVGRDRFLTHEEEDTLIATLRVWGQHEAADLVMFLLDTGCRLGEALDLRWSSVTPKQVTFLDTKNGSNRSVPLTARLREMLSKHRVMPNGSVFSGFDGGRKLRKVWDRVKRHMKLDGDPLFVIHILRHTCASRLAQAGVPLLEISKWLGHKSIKVTMRYAHLAPTSLDKLTAILEQRPTDQPRHLGVVEGGKS